ncbi:hemolysin III family protein [candidate division WOR-3 bacterium]|nr:hemolysin III family protein [candidate division WOR-3 bacterium]
METTRAKKRDTPGEEIASSITHGIGAALSMAGIVFLVVLATMYGDVWRIVSFSIYGATLIILYVASTLYHGFRNQKAKRIFRIIDHSSIFLLIAGTYTPFLLVSLRGVLGWTLFGIIWSLAGLGIVFKALFIGRHGRISVFIYVIMGWLCVVAIRQMFANIPVGGIIGLAAGGVLYTAGIIFYAWSKLRYGHAIWHLFVLGGSVFHYFSIFFYVLPKR